MKNLVNTTFCHRGAFEYKQLEEARKVMGKINNERVKTINSKNVYITRKQTEARNINKKLDKMLEKYKFQKVDMAELTLGEQVELMSNAECVIAPHGAGLTHIINMKKGTKVIEVMPSILYIHFTGFCRILMRLTTQCCLQK